MLEKKLLIFALHLIPLSMALLPSNLGDRTAFPTTFENRLMEVGMDMVDTNMVDMVDTNMVDMVDINMVDMVGMEKRGRGTEGLWAPRGRLNPLSQYL